MEVTIRRDRKVVKPPLPPGEIDMKNIGIFIDVQNIYYTTRDVYNKQFKLLYSFNLKFLFLKIFIRLLFLRTSIKL